MSTGYIAPWGNDDNNGLTWGTAKKTPAGSIGSSLSPNYVTGTIYKPNSYQNIKPVGVRTAYVWAATNTKPNWGDGSVNFITKGGYTLVPGRTTNYTCLYSGSSSLITSGGYVENSVIKAPNAYVEIVPFTYTTVIGDQIEVRNGEYNNIIIARDILMNYATGTVGYNLFVNIETMTVNSNSYTVTGDTNEEKLQSMKDAYDTEFPDYPRDTFWANSRYYTGDVDDIFNDYVNGDMSLLDSTTNPVLIMQSETGQKIGGRYIAKQDKIGNYSSLVNIDTSGNITADTDWSCESEIYDCGKIVNIRSIECLFENNSYFGQINTQDNVSSAIDAGTGVLTIGKIYRVYDADIVHDSVTYSSGQNFTATTTDFTTTESGYVKEIYDVENSDIDRFSSKLQIKCSKSDSTLENANALTFYRNTEIEGVLLMNFDQNGEPLYGDADTDFDDSTAVQLQLRYYQVLIEGKYNNLN